jgi:hypothetical protein
MKKKTGRKTGTLVPQPHGGAILNGACDPSRHVPGPGKTPEAFRLACRQLASSAERFALAKRVLDDPDTYPSLWLGALKWATEHGYGKPKETVEHTGEIKHGVVILPAVQGK